MAQLAPLLLLFEMVTLLIHQFNPRSGALKLMSASLVELGLHQVPPIHETLYLILMADYFYNLCNTFVF